MRLVAKLALCWFVMAVPATAAERVTVAVMGLFHPQRVVVETAARPLLVIAGKRQFVIGEDGRGQVSFVRSGKQIVLRSGGVRMAAAEVKVAARAGDEDLVLSIPGKIRRTYHGQLSIIAESAELVPIVEMDLETAVASVLAAELPADTPLEALKAQAIASRSYLVAGGPRHRHAEFCDTTHCEFLRNPPAATSPAARATAATQGLVLAWRDKPFAAMYSASCGGHTHSLAEVGYAARDYPYFAVECPYCRRAPERWSSTIPARDAAALGSDRGRIEVGRRRGWNKVQSNTFNARKTGDAVTLIGVGRGHGVGLCERGAAGMARDGHSVREVLAHYFPNTTIMSLPSR